ncbi:hypothetical protein PVAP13_9KG623600 [Panicum virgatum]|uniref:DUF8040 domain-containing protein n=1 Tax=Panicum virgatum TaxID=38727 RepID=A0A8T0NV44_PANVG|nr:hypothetical protein PVAP13_9KG623600 [Panicum virgatum]
MFLHVVGHNQRFRVIHQNFRRSIETFSRYFREVLYAVGELREELIRAPSGETVLKNRNSPRWFPYLKVSEVVTQVGGAQQVQEGAEQRTRGAMRWTSAMSKFVLKRMCQLIESGVRTDKGFKEVHLNQVAKYLQRWVRVSKLRELSGALWVDDVCMISLEEEHYLGHIKAHPKNAEFLNKHIENYKEMETIFGNGLATGKYAMGSNEALGSPSDFADGFVKTEPCDEDKAAKVMEDAARVFAEVCKENKEENSGPSNKRKRCVLTEEDHVVFTGMTEAVKDVAAAIRETKVEVVNPDLYGAVMYMPGFTEEALIVAFSHLVDNKAQGDAFVNMSDSHRVLWLRTWLAKHYYM